MSYHASLLTGGDAVISNRQKMWFDDSGGDKDFNDYTFEITGGDAYWMGDMGNRKAASSTTCDNAVDQRTYHQCKAGTWCPYTVKYNFNQNPTGTASWVTQWMVRFGELRIRMNTSGTLTITTSRDAGHCNRLLLFDADTIDWDTPGTTTQSPTCVYTGLVGSNGTIPNSSISLVGGKQYVAHFQKNSKGNCSGSWGIDYVTLSGYCIGPWDPGQGDPDGVINEEEEIVYWPCLCNPVDDDGNTINCANGGFGCSDPDFPGCG